MKTFNVNSFKKYINDIGREFVDDLIGQDVEVFLVPTVSVCIRHSRDLIVVYAKYENVSTTTIVGRVDFTGNPADTIVAMHYFIERCMQQNPMLVVNARRFDDIDDLFVKKAAA